MLNDGLSQYNIEQYTYPRTPETILYGLLGDIEDYGWPAIERELSMSGLSAAAIHSVKMYHDRVLYVAEQAAQAGPMAKHKAQVWVDVQMEALVKAYHNRSYLFHELIDATTFFIAHHPQPTSGQFYPYKKYDTPNCLIHLGDVVNALEAKSLQYPSARIQQVLRLPTLYPQLGQAFLVLFDHVRTLMHYEGGLEQCAADLAEANLPEKYCVACVEKVGSCIYYPNRPLRPYLLQMMRLAATCPASMNQKVLNGYSSDYHYGILMPADALAQQNVEKTAKYVAAEIAPFVNEKTAGEVFYKLIPLASYPSFDDCLSAFRTIKDGTINGSKEQMFENAIAQFSDLTGIFVRGTQDTRPIGTLPPPTVWGNDVVHIAAQKATKQKARLYDVFLYKGIDRQYTIDVLTVVDYGSDSSISPCERMAALFEHVEPKMSEGNAHEQKQFRMIAHELLREAGIQYIEIIAESGVPEELFYRLVLGRGIEECNGYTLADAAMVVEIYELRQRTYQHASVLVYCARLEDIAALHPRLANYISQQRNKAINSFAYVSREVLRPAGASIYVPMTEADIVKEVNTTIDLWRPVSTENGTEKNKDGERLKTIYNYVDTEERIEPATYQRIHHDAYELIERYPVLARRLQEKLTKITHNVFTAVAGHKVLAHIPYELLESILLSPHAALYRELFSLLFSRPAVVDRATMVIFCDNCKEVRTRFPHLAVDIDAIEADALRQQGLSSLYDFISPAHLNLARAIVTGMSTDTRLVIVAQVGHALWQLNTTDTPTLANMGMGVMARSAIKDYLTTIPDFVTSAGINSALRILADTWPQQSNDRTREDTDLGPAVAELLQEIQATPGYMMVGVKLHVDRAIPDYKVEAARVALRLPESTSFGTIHSGKTLLFPPNHPAVLKLQLLWCKQFGLFGKTEEGIAANDNDFDLQVCIGGRIKGRMCRSRHQKYPKAGILGSAMLLATEASPLYDIDAWKPKLDHHLALTNAYIMAYDDGIKIDGLPYDLRGAKGRTDMLGRRHLNDLDLYRFLATLVVHAQCNARFAELYRKFTWRYMSLLEQYEVAHYPLNKIMCSAPWVFDPQTTPLHPNATTKSHWEMVDTFARVRLAANDQKKLGITGEVRSLIREIQEEAALQREDIIRSDPHSFDRMRRLMVA